MYKNLGYFLLSCIIIVVSINSAHAGFIVFTDRMAYENAVNSALDFEGFNSQESLNDNISFNTGKYKDYSNLVSEGEKALRIFENNDFTLTFSYEVFAIGFDLNELNGSDLSYSDNAGNYISQAFMGNNNANQNTFFGLISDTAFTSFDLISTHSSNATAVYGLDALSYTASPTDVPTPTTFLLMLSSLAGLLFVKRLAVKQ